jgi:hypothetical protein
MRKLITLLITIIFSSITRAAIHRVPYEYSTISQAITAARDGDTIRVGPGTYVEKLMLVRSISLIGEDSRTCILKGNPDSSGDALITVEGRVQIAGLTIRDGATGILVKAGASLKIEGCTIAACANDGIGFDTAFNTNLFMRNCLVTENVDGVDLESTQGVILSSKFTKNTDDGLDYDGDAGVLVYGCEFADNEDDGIEIRLSRRTHAIVLDSTFESNGEDGVEIINSPEEGGIYNLLCIQNCLFRKNRRYGVGFVAHGIEKHSGEMSKVAVYAAGNTFVGTGKGNVSPNYVPIFDAPEAYPKTVKATLERMSNKTSQELVVQMPLLVGIYNLRPSVDGAMVEDAEGVSILGGRVYVADDTSRSIFVLDRHTGATVDVFSTYPFPGSTYKAPGPEGLDIIPYKGRDALLLADDDGRSLFTLSLAKEHYGHVLDRQVTSFIGAAEGCEQIGSQLILAAGGNRLHCVGAEELVKGAESVTLTFNDFGSHIAGVGADETGTRVFVTLSGYRWKGSSKTRNHRSAFFEMDPTLTEVRAFWHLGPFSNDPRGISSADGLIYVADGRSDFEDEQTGEINRGGIKVLVFLLEDSPEVLNKALSFLPIRYEASQLR